MLMKIVLKNQNSEVICPVCDSANPSARYEYEYDRQKSFIYECPSCSLQFARPIIIPEIDQRQMDSINDAELYHNVFYKRLHEHFVLRREIESVRKIKGNGRLTLLDVGCGTGWTSAFWQRNDFNVTGLEPSEKRGQLAHERYGIRIIPQYLEHAAVEEKFDVIVLRHVIEHFASPYDMVKKAISLLADGGVMVLIVPNIDCIGKFIFDADWTWVLPWHCTFFNPRSLVTLLNRAGLDTLKLYQTPSPLYYGESLARKYPASSFSNYVKRHCRASFLVSAPLAALGVLTGHGDNITIIARKASP